MGKKICEIFEYDGEEKAVQGPHGENRRLCGPCHLLKLRTPFPESCEHAYYLDISSWEICDLDEETEARLKLVLEESV